MISYQSFYPNWKFEHVRMFNSRMKKFLNSHGLDILQISYFFGSDDWLLEINKDTFNHDYYTDIVTIDYGENLESLLHIDMFISIDRVRENAQTFSISFEKELFRVMIHGVLHCMGYDDIDELLKSDIREKENEFLLLF